MQDRENQISVLAKMNLKLAAFMFKLIKHCFKDYDIRCVNIKSVLKYKHQWELEQKKTEDLEQPKVDKNNWANTMKNTVLHLRLVIGMRGTLLAYVVWYHVKVAHIYPGYDAYLNLNKEMITRAPIVDAKLNLRLSQDSLDRGYLKDQVDTFKIDNALVFQILAMVFTDRHACVYMKQRKSMQDGWAVFFYDHKRFLGPDHVVRQAAEAEGKLKNSHYDDEIEAWNRDKYDTLHKD